MNYMVLLVDLYNIFLLSGMNFYDFFIFLARFSLANSMLLENLTRDTTNAAGSSFPIVQQLAQNLCSIHKITSKMKSMECFSGDQGFVLDLGETHKDPKFFQLCESLFQTYESIHKQQISSFHTTTITTHDSKTSNVTRNFRVPVSSPQDLVEFIDTVLTRHSSLPYKDDL